MNTFRRSLEDPDTFTVTYELVPGRSTRSRQFRQIVRFMEEAARDRRLHGVSITENAGGHPTLAPVVLGREARALGLDPILHFSCKDKNRNQMESTLFALDQEGLHNLLIITGDYPRYGFLGNAKPVFDLDAVQLLRLISELERGFELPPEAPGGGVRLPPMPFFKGCVVSPFKRYEPEVMTQYYKLHRKVAAGARFVVTQVGFDARKFDELRRYMRLAGLDVPLLGGVLVMDLRLARIIRRGAVPGCRLTETFFARVQEEARRSGDGGHRAALVRAAKLAAVLRGLDYDGVHLCGARPSYEDILFFFEKFEEYRPRWREFLDEFRDAEPDTFYLFRQDRETGLNTDEVVERADAHRAPLSLWVNRLFHRLFFEPGRGLYPLAQRLARRIKGSWAEGLVTRFEHALKGHLFSCQQCGDCALGETAFLCPQSQCAKGLLNGPCGGSRDGFCEVHPSRRCLYVRVYERLRALGEEETLKEGFVPPRDWSLFGTSSWLNYYLGLDHHRFSRD